MPWLVRVFTIVVLSLIVWGFYDLMLFDGLQGTSGAVPDKLPNMTAVFHTSDKATLIMAVHPHCPCTRASIYELHKIMTRCRSRVNATVLFFTPPAAGFDWAKTDLYQQAEAIPQLRLIEDQNGKISHSFGAQTSGHTLLYDKNGHLVFSGGITGERGHNGDNQGESTIVSFLMGGEKGAPTTPVFGCSLLSRECREFGLSVMPNCPSHEQKTIKIKGNNDVR